MLWRILDILGPWTVDPDWGSTTYYYYCYYFLLCCILDDIIDHYIVVMITDTIIHIINHIHIIMN